MDFSQRLNGLFVHMGFSNAKVARLGELDTSVISRFRTGKRVPSGNGKQLEKLCRGVVLLAREYEETDKLCAFCGISDSEIDEPLTLGLLEWLICNTVLEGRRKIAAGAFPPQQKPLRAFSAKLDALMTAFDVSNIRIAHALHIDPSMISRYRTGMRVPLADSWIPNEICTWFVARVLTLSNNERNARLVPLLGEKPPQEPKTLAARLLDWLLSEHIDSEQSLTTSFLERIDAFRKSEPLPPEILGMLKNVEPVKKSTSVYCGVEGLREAVRRFLSLAAVQPKPVTLHLYSDQQMGWLSGNPEFAQQWATLMVLNLHVGNRIQIIHNIDRSLPEMFDAISKWLPLYMTGLIKPFYVPVMGEKRFSKTMFILPEKAAVSASFVTGTEAAAEYLFTTVSARVENEENQFQALLATALPLVRIFPIAELPAFFSFFDSAVSLASETKLLTPSLSLATMPREVLESIMKRNMLTPQQTRSLLALWEYEVRWFEKMVVAGLQELAAMPDDEMLFSGSVPVAAPVQLCGRMLFYDAAEYSRHVENIRTLLLRYPRYSFYPLPISPFENVYVVVNGKGLALVIKIDEPGIVFLFEHPLMCHSLSRFLDTLCQNAVQDGQRRDSVEQFLEKYAE